MPLGSNGSIMHGPNQTMHCKFLFKSYEEEHIAPQSITNLLPNCTVNISVWLHTVFLQYSSLSVFQCTINSKINSTTISVHSPISKLHAILAVANLLVHNNITISHYVKVTKAKIEYSFEMDRASEHLWGGSRKKSHEDKIPCRKKSHEQKSQRKKSHEDKIPEDKIPSEKKSHAGKYPKRTKSHKEKIPQGNIPLFWFLWNLFLDSNFKCEKFTNFLYYISILCSLSLFHFHCQMKSLHSPVFFLLTKHHDQ